MRSGLRVVCRAMRFDVKGVCPPLPFGTVLLFREGQTERNLSSSDMIVNEAGANRPRYVIYTAS